MKNSVFNADINADTHKANLDLAKKNLEIASATLKSILTFVQIFSNISIDTLPKIGVEIASLVAPLVAAQEKIVEATIQQAKSLVNLKNLEELIPLPELSKVNPIKNISKPDLINQSLSGVQDIAGLSNTNIPKGV